MKSSTGEHFIALDHIRALAAFLVVCWHFTHAWNGYPIPFEYVPNFFPFALLDEGQTGVALFMTLSGYLFAKLLDGKVIRYRSFLFNRALRLLPLLIVAILLNALVERSYQHDLLPYFAALPWGLIYPTLPNGGWSITVEFHYYLAIPLFLWMFRRSRYLPLLIVAAAIVLRAVLYERYDEIQSLAYKTIIGRIDQFALGMIFFHFRSVFRARHFLSIGILAAFCLFYFVFDWTGGFYNSPVYPSPSWLWIFMPTIEGAAYATGIAWYDSSFTPKNTGVSRLAGHLGSYSYSIYLLHFFVVFKAAAFVDENITDISNFYVACFWALVFFVLMMPVGYLSFRFIESPFLKLRRRYTVASKPGVAAAARTPEA